MNESHGFWWEVIDTVSRWIALILAAGFGWLAKKFASVEARMDTMETTFTKQDHEAAINIAVLQSYHQANTQRLDSIEDTTQRIDGKIDQLIASLRKP